MDNYPTGESDYRYLLKKIESVKSTISPIQKLNFKYIQQDLNNTEKERLSTTADVLIMWLDKLKKKE